MITTVFPTPAPPKTDLASLRVWFNQVNHLDASGKNFLLG